MSGNKVFPAVPDLDVITENLIVPDFQRLDARLFPFALLDFLQHFFAVVSDSPILVKLRVVTGLDDSSLANGKPRFVHDSAIQEIDQFVIRTDIILPAPEQIGPRRRHQRFDARQSRQGNLQRDKIPGVGRADFRPRQQALKIVYLLHALPQPRTHGIIPQQLFHGVMPRPDVQNGSQRLLQPSPQQPSPHRRSREIKHVEKRVFLSAVPQIARDLQIAERRRVKHKPPGSLQPCKPADMAEIGHNGLMQIVKERRQRRLRIRVARPILRTEMAQHHLFRTFHRRKLSKRTALHSLGRKIPDLLPKRKRSRKQKLRRRQSIKLVQRRLHPVLPFMHAVKAFSRGNIRAGKHDALAVFIQKDDIIILRRGQRILGKNRSRRDDLDDLAFRQARRFRVADLLGNSHLIALADQLCDIVFCRMIRHAAHRRFFRIPAAACQGKAQFFGHKYRVVEKHLIKIAQTEKKNLVRVLLLGLLILPHHRREFHAVASLRKLHACHIRAALCLLAHSGRACIALTCVSPTSLRTLSALTKIKE